MTARKVWASMARVMSQVPVIKLNNGVEIPQLGLGVFQAVSYTHLTLPTTPYV